jgi:hypothetical protein
MAPDMGKTGNAQKTKKKKNENKKKTFVSEPKK